MKADIRKLVHASPFVPFTIHLADGGQLRVSTVDHIAIPPAGGRNLCFWRRRALRRHISSHDHARHGGSRLDPFQSDAVKWANKNGRANRSEPISFGSNSS